MSFYILLYLTSYCLYVIKQTWKFISSRPPVGLLGWTCCVIDSCVCLNRTCVRMEGSSVHPTPPNKAHSVRTVLQPNIHQQRYELEFIPSGTEWVDYSANGELAPGCAGDMTRRQKKVTSKDTVWELCLVFQWARFRKSPRTRDLCGINRLPKEVWRYKST